MKNGLIRIHPRPQICVYLWPRHAGPGLALSTLYRTHRRYGAFFVGRNGGDVFLLHVTKSVVSEVRIGFVPGKAREVFLEPGLFEHLAVTRVDLLSHLAGILEE